VIDPTPGALDRLGDDPAERWLLRRPRRRGGRPGRPDPFNAIGDAAAKVDFIVRRERPFSIAEFERRREVELLGSIEFVASVEVRCVIGEI
jgi:hypothetical protein